MHMNSNNQLSLNTSGWLGVHWLLPSKLEDTESALRWEAEQKKILNNIKIDDCYTKKTQSKQIQKISKPFPRAAPFPVFRIFSKSHQAATDPGRYSSTEKSPADWNKRLPDICIAT